MAKTPRYQAVDVARGVAFVAMFIYHATFFAMDRGLVDVDLGEPGWRAFQRSIAGTFYFLVGVSLVLANRERIELRSWLMRMGKLCGAAFIVTVASYVLEPSMLVSYGILHNIAVCSTVGLLFLRWGRWNIGLGALVMVTDLLVSTPVFNAPWLLWTGLGSAQPATFDFQPFFPWFGVVCSGMWAGWELARAPEGGVARWHSELRVAWGLRELGRWSLFLYLAHVPVLVGTMEVLGWVLGV